MAGPQSPPKARGLRQATVVDLSKPASSASAVRSPMTTGGAIRITRADVTDPDRLVRALNDIQDALAVAAAPARSSPHAAPCVVRGVNASMGAVLVVRHTLERAYTDWWTCGAYGMQAIFSEVKPGDATYPNGTDPTKALVVQSSCQGVFSFVINGD